MCEVKPIDEETHLASSRQVKESHEVRALKIESVAEQTEVCEEFR